VGPDLSSQHAFVQEPGELVLIYELAVFEAFFGAEFLGDGKCEFECDRSVEVSVDIGRIACSRHLELEESIFKASM